MSISIPPSSYIEILIPNYREGAQAGWVSIHFRSPQVLSTEALNDTD